MIYCILLGKEIVIIECINAMENLKNVRNGTISSEPEAICLI